MMALVIAASASALTAYLMKWHAVREDNFGLGCAFLPDCDPSFFAGIGVTFTDSGYAHYGAGPLALLACVLLFSAVSAIWPRWTLGLAATLVGLVLLAATAASTFELLVHGFHNVTALLPAHAFWWSLRALVALMVANLALHPILFIGQRRGGPSAGT